jgi:hypothetical protein
MLILSACTGLTLYFILVNQHAVAKKHDNNKITQATL